MSKKEIRIFISSPSDVQEERDALRALVEDDLQRIVGDRNGLHLVPVMWEEQGRPEMGNIQENLFEQLGDFDIFIGIFWHRFGTPTGEFESGSEAEFRAAYEKKKKDPHFPIMMYFCGRHLPADVDTKQLEKVRTFRKEVQSMGLTWPYDEVSDLIKKVGKHLSNAIYDVLDNERRKIEEAGKRPFLGGGGAQEHVQAEASRSISGELLVYMLNRTSICEQIEEAILDQDETPEKPIFCIIHGDSDQCIGEFVQRLQQVDLPNLWDLDQRTEKVHEIRFVWPGVPRKLGRFHGKITRSLSRAVKPIFRTPDDLKAYIEQLRAPVLISSHFLASNWERYGEAEIMESYMDYWRQLYPIRQRVVVLLSVKYDSYSSAKVESSLPYPHVEDALMELIPPECQSVILNVPDRLPNVTPADVEGWAWAYCKKEIHETQMKQLFLSEKEFEHGVPMEDIVNRLHPILPL